MPPITVVFIATGLVVWLNALYFLGVGADQKEGGTNPLVGIGHASFLVGVLKPGASRLHHVGSASG